MTKQETNPMKPIKITNTEALAEAIKTAEGRATARTITPADMQRGLNAVDERLALVSTKKDAIGTEVWIDMHAQSFPNAYRYTPESTCFRAILKASGWHVVDIRRAPTKAPTKRITIKYTDATISHMVERLMWIA